jgi:hypothetical protein
MVLLVSLALLAIRADASPEIQLRSGAILIPAVIDGKPRRLILDTGMPQSVLDPKLLEEAGDGPVKIRIPGSPEFAYDADPRKQLPLAPETWENERRLGASGFLGLGQLKKVIVGVDLLTGQFLSWPADYGQDAAMNWLKADRTLGDDKPEMLGLRLGKDYVYLNINREGKPRLPILDFGCDLSIDPQDVSGDRGAAVAQTSAFFPVGETHPVTLYEGANYSSSACTIRRLSTLADSKFGGPLFGWHAFSGARFVVDVAHRELWIRWRSSVSTPLTRSLSRMGLAVDLEGKVAAAFGPAKAAGLQPGDQLEMVNGAAVFAKDGGLDVAEAPEMVLALNRNLYSFLMLKVKQQKTGKEVYMVLAPSKGS